MKSFVLAAAACGWALTVSACAGDGAASDDSMGAGAAGAQGLGGDSSGAGGTSQQPTPPECGEEPSAFVTDVLEHAFGGGQAVGQDEFPEPILGPPQGAGALQGASHVVSLGDQGFVAVEFEGNYIVDGPGADFLVFENPFLIGGDETNPFAELGEVAVSQDGAIWFSFACERRDYPYDDCAGWRPVLANADDPPELARDPERAGGDPFDLAEVGLDWARYVRVTDVSDGAATAFDLDAIAIVHAGCEEP